MNKWGIALSAAALLIPCGAFAQGRLPSPALNNPTITGGTITGANASGANVTVPGATTAAPISRLAPLSLLGFGATCDGTANDSAAVTAAIASGMVINLPSGATCNAASTNWLSMPGMWMGDGTSRIKANDGYARGPIFMEQTTAPTPASSYNVQTYWTGDWSKSLGVEKLLLGTATAGQPATGYTLVPEISALTIGEYSNSGWNQSLAGNAGRTAVPVLNMHPAQYGQGDMTAIWCSGIVGSTTSTVASASFSGNTMTVVGTPALTLATGSSVTGPGISAGTTIFAFGTGSGGAGTYTLSKTAGTIAQQNVTIGPATYIASPALECMGGTLFGGADGQYIEWLGDMNIADNGNDIAAVGIVSNFNRTNATEGIGANWMGRRVSFASSTVPGDLFDQFAGPAAIGMDYSNADLSTYRLAAYTFAGGTGYVAGDTITATAGTSYTPTVWQILTVDGGGAPLTMKLVNSGLYSAVVVPASYVALATSGGTGTGLVISGQYTNNIFVALPAAGGCLISNASVGGVTNRMTGVSGELCITQKGIQIGNAGGNTNISAAGANNFQVGKAHFSNALNSYQFGRGCLDNGQNNTFCIGGAGSDAGGQVGINQTTTRMFWKTGTAQVRLTVDGAAPSQSNTYKIARGMEHLRFTAQAVDSTNGDTATWECGHQACVGTLTLATTGGTAVYNGDAATATAPDRSTGAGSTASLIVAADNSTVAGSWNVQMTPPNANLWYFQMTVVGDHLGF